MCEKINNIIVRKHCKFIQSIDFLPRTVKPWNGRNVWRMNDTDSYLHASTGTDDINLPISLGYHNISRWCSIACLTWVCMLIGRARMQDFRRCCWDILKWSAYPIRHNGFLIACLVTGTRELMSCRVLVGYRLFHSPTKNRFASYTIWGVMPIIPINSPLETIIWKHTYRQKNTIHYGDAIMGVMVSQITSPAIIYSTVYSGSDQIKLKPNTRLASKVYCKLLLKLITSQ